jgi:hypothetical protein
VIITHNPLSDHLGEKVAAGLEEFFAEFSNT